MGCAGETGKMNMTVLGTTTMFCVSLPGHRFTFPCWEICLFVCLFRFNVAFNIICHITTVSGCDRELNAHFYSAASLWYQIPDSFT